MSNMIKESDPVYCDEEETIYSLVSKDDIQFDTVVGHIEDILIDKEFQVLQRNFFDKYCHVFTAGEENKLEYMDIFTEYTNLIEKYIEVKLINLMPSFSMEIFIRQLEKRKNDIEGEVFELLFSFSDFLAFKELILDYRDVRDGKVHELGDCILVSPLFST